MKLYYWCPFFSNIATEKAVINSIEAIIKFSKKKINPFLLDVIGEWDKQKLYIQKKNIPLYHLVDFKIISYLPKMGFIKSRVSYILVFLFSIIKLHKFLKKEKPDFLIVHLMTFIPLFLLCFFSYNTKFVLRISGYPKLNYLRQVFWKMVGKKIHLVTCPTRSTLELLNTSKIFDSRKLHYLPDPVLNFNELNKKKNLKKISSKKNIISIGRLTRQKNFQFLIKGFNELLKEYPELNLTILGEGEERKKLENLINSLNLKDKIFLVGYKKNIYEYLEKAEIFILSSLWEDPGFVLIESGYANKIVLSSDCPNGPRELLDNGKNGFLFRNNSMNDFIDKFREIQNTDKNLILNKKILLKKKIKEFTLLNHYKILNSLFLKNEN